jgi:processive 1,2-diacylglycerol beta-glucosyltransferase
MSRRILLLSASAGAGHVRAADALLKAFDAQNGGLIVEHWDMLKYTNRVFRHLYSQLYLDLVNRMPEMLGWFYDLSDTPNRNQRARILFEKLNSARFVRALKRFEPELVICTHFTPAAILSWLFETGKVQLKPAIVVTDLDCHAMWLVPNYSQYFVARDETKNYLTRIGIDPSRIFVTGISIDPVFETVPDKREVKKSLGLDPDRFTILVSAGGYGVGPVEPILGELLQVKRAPQVIAIAGRSASLKEKIDNLAKSQKSTGAALISVGFTTEIDRYMAAADLFVGKAGGLTTSESLARGLPLCIVNPIPGQEERNSDHLLEEGVAIRCNNLPALSWKINELISDEARFKQMQQKVAVVARRDAARAIAKLVVDSPVAS